MYFVAGNLPEPCGQYLFNCECNAYSFCYASILNIYIAFKYKLALTMALYGGFDMTFVKMPKYLATNKYQNKDFAHPPLTNPPRCGTL